MDGAIGELLPTIIIAAGVIVTIALGLFIYLIIVLKQLHKSVEEFKGLRIIENLDRARRVDIELPGLLGRISIPYERLPDFLKTLGIPPWIVHGQDKAADARSERADETIYKIYERMSGLEFSRESGKIKCPQHGWQSFRIDEEGRLRCSVGDHVIFDPIEKLNEKERELEGLRNKLSNLERELEELKHSMQQKANRARKEGSTRSTNRESPSEEQS
ncbi:MAG: hypothetical protein QXS26_04090 [Thermosphaera sp.]